VKHVRRLAELGQFPKPVKVGRLRRWRRQAVELWIEQQQQQQQGGSNDAN
jgi:predicted DNA-binding transcriptional regulator AlpA